MVARLQRLFVFGTLGCLLGWICIGWRSAHPLIAIGGPMVLAACYFAILAVEFVMSTFVSKTGIAARAEITSLCIAYVHEVQLAFQTFCWRQPFRSAKYTDLCATRDRGSRGVVLIHGLWCNRGFWNPWMHKLRSIGVPYVAVNLEPVYCSIDAYIATVGAAVLSIEEATGLKPVVVAHSMGGLAARAWMSRAPQCASLVRHLVTIGTPHHGTWLARFSTATNGQQMRIGSSWISELEKRESVADRPYRHVTCFYSDRDNVVFPSQTATLPGADNRLIHGVAHIQLAFCPDVFAAVLQLVRN